MNDLYVSLRYATFLLLVREGKIAEAPPIAKWTEGKPVLQVQRYFLRKGAEVEEI